MKLAVFLMLVSFMGVFASETYSQNTNLSVKGENISLEDFLIKIENQSEFRFFYAGKIDIEKKISGDYKNKKITEILDDIKDEAGIQYEVMGRQIILSPKNSDNSIKSSQQQRTISGKVTDSSGAPLPGVTVVVRGTTKGTVTDFDGNYAIAEVQADATLVFSFVGMKSQEISVGNQSAINLVMEEDAIGIEEIVAIGYGTSTVKELTGSVGSVRGDDIVKTGNTSFDKALQGKIAGVQVIQTTGAPGGAASIRVRGIGSISASSEPLYVIDGFPLDNEATEASTGWSNSKLSLNPLSSIDPNDIESIDILKDAAASAIYGSRGANGVVIITTKKGREGKTLIEFSHMTGWQAAANIPDVMNAEEYLDLMIETRNNTWIDGDPENRSANDLDNVRPGYLKIGSFNVQPEYDTNWYEEILRTALTSNYGLSLRGGTEQINYAISGGYFNQDGIIKGSGFERYTFRANFNVKASEKLKVGFNFAPSISVHDRVRTESRGNFVQGSIIHTAMAARPTFPVYNEDGSYFNHRAAGTPPFLSNPLYLINELSEDVTVMDMTSNFFGSYNLVPELELKVSLGGRYNTVKNHQFAPKSTHWPPFESQRGSAYAFQSQSLSWLNENTLTYTKIINGNDLTILGGASFQSWNLDRLNASTNDFANNNVKIINAGSNITGVSEGFEKWTLTSFLFRATYNIKDKYLFNATTRTDGSSRFGAETKYGFFPSGSFGWRFTEEEFWSENAFLNDGKFRASYGISGNNSIGNYSKYALLGNTRYILGNSQNVVGGFSPTSIANEELGWETSAMLNMGLDLYMLNDRVSLTAEYYVKRTKDLLLNVPVPITTGFTSALMNTGEIRNWGWDFNLNTTNIDRQFKWTSRFNISFGKNKLISLGGAGDNGVLLLAPPIWGMGDIYLNKEGEPFSQFYGYIADGIFQNEQELIGYEELQPNAKPGDYRFVDVNNDGIIDPSDRTVIGNALPDFFYGLTNNFSFNNLELSFFIQGVNGGDVYNLNRQSNGHLSHTSNAIKEAHNRWRSEESPGDGFWPRASAEDKNGNNRFSTRWIEDGSYLRIKNIKLSYRLPRFLIHKAGIKNAIIYVEGYNLVTLTNYTGFDPEASYNSNDPLMQGLDWSVYPVSKSYNVGVNLSF